MRDAVTVYPYKITDALKQSKRKVLKIYLVGLHGTEVIVDSFARNYEEARNFIGTAGPRRSVVN